MPGELDMPADSILLELYRRMVLGRRFDTQATALTKQGRLAVYPRPGPGSGQIGAVAALRHAGLAVPDLPRLVALVARGVDPVEVLTLLRGDWHCGYDPYLHRVAPQCTPLATNAPHAVGLAHAARLKGEDTVALVMLGDGATSEGDTHDGAQLRAVWNSPVVFFVQNNGYAISVPLARQTAAPSWRARESATGSPASSSTATMRPRCTRCPAGGGVERRPAAGRLSSRRSRTASRPTPTPTTPPATGPRPRCRAGSPATRSTRLRQYLPAGGC